MDTTLAPVLALTGTSAPDLDHYFCCNDDVALCGTDISGTPYITGAMARPCVVCVDLGGRFGCQNCCPTH